MTLKLNDALIDIKRSYSAEREQKAEYSKSEYLKADEFLTDKKKKVEQAEGELSKVKEALDEAVRKNETALDWYREGKADADSSDLFDRAAGLSDKNEELRTKVQVLQDKLQIVYDFMK